MNKNTRRKRMSKAFRKAAKLSTDAADVRLSGNPKRNMEMRVYRWKDQASGTMCSKTLHCKANDKLVAFPKPRRDIKLKPGQKQHQPAATEADNKAADAELASTQSED